MKKQKTSKRRRIFRAILIPVGSLLLVLLLLLGESFIPKRGGNPYSGLLSKADRNFISSLNCLDEAESFYSAEYQGEYSAYSEALAKILNLGAKPGCTAFTCKDPSGETVTCRNFDCTHFHKDGTPGSLSVLVHTVGGDKYETYGVADAFWLNSVGLTFYEGSLSDGKTNLSLIPLLPFLCMDGMNEKGLTASILAVDITEEESPVYVKGESGETGIVTVLLRRILDSCATLEEAVEYARHYNLRNIDGTSYHIYVTDAAGNSAVLEWRYGEFFAVSTDVATNFFLAYDDAEDVVRDGELIETFTPPTSEALQQYHYGYGHGYGRFFTVASALAEAKTEAGQLAVFSEEERLQIQKSAWQYTNGTSSQSIYSVQYSAETLTVSLVLFSNPEKTYTLSFGPNGP